MQTKIDGNSPVKDQSGFKFRSCINEDFLYLSNIITELLIGKISKICQKFNAPMNYHFNRPSHNLIRFFFYLHILLI